MRKKARNNSVLSEQDIKNNNYLSPLDAYKSFQNYSIPKNVTNTETYNIAKEKLFAKDINSSLKKGKLITKKEFIENKKNFSKKICKTERSENKKVNRLENLKTENNINIIDKEKKPMLEFKDPNDYTKTKLDSRFLYFDKNNNQFLRHKNWWSVDK